MSDRVPFRIVEITEQPPVQPATRRLQTVRYLSVRIAVAALLLLPVFCLVGLNR